jgi:hypothetical protein
LATESTYARLVDLEILLDQAEEKKS